MSKIVVSNKFKRSFRKFTRRNTKLQRKIEEVITQLSEDIFDPSLATHKLGGKLADLLACSCGKEVIEMLLEDEDIIFETEFVGTQQIVI